MYCYLFEITLFRNENILLITIEACNQNIQKRIFVPFCPSVINVSFFTLENIFNLKLCHDHQQVFIHYMEFKKLAHPTP